MGTPVAPTPAALVAAEFLSYLQIRKGLKVAGYLRPPKAVPDSWETYTYRLQLDGGPDVPAALRRPLALRVYAGPEGLPRLRREWALQNRLAVADYPVARPVLREEDPDFLGGPFLLMEWVEGETMFDWLARDYLAFLPGGAPWQMADLHARLHRMPAGDLPGSERPFLDRELEAIEAAVAGHGLSGLAAGLEWLRERRPADAEPPCLLHLDLHPKNIVVRGWRCVAVLDWSESDVGDRHADVAMALLHMKTAPVENASGLTRLMLPIGRFLTRMMYYNGYRRRLPIDPGRLRYYQAWAALRRLARFGRWVCVGPHVNGYKPDARRHICRRHVADLERYFERYSGVAVRLGLALPQEAAPAAAA
jgi:aminoglycoside phosphotransferase (APT) family kinase protein